MKTFEMCKCVCVFPHILREVQQGEHKGNILLSVLQWTVAEVTIVTPIT